jgi:nitrate/nitrite-specific signal transduction histidine kinase
MSISQNDFKKVLEEQVQNELLNIPTFSEEMVENIKELYKKLDSERELWLQNKEEVLDKTI